MLRAYSSRPRVRSQSDGWKVVEYGGPELADELERSVYVRFTGGKAEAAV